MPKETFTNWPVILTGTIVQNPEAIGKREEPQIREQQYMRTLEWMAKARTGVKTVIFCENSEASLESFEYLSKLWRKRRLSLEIYKVPMSREEVFLGKGWGEGQIIRWALENVHSLGECEGFIKITGRHQLLNVKRVIEVIRRGMGENPNLKFVCQSFAKSGRPVVHTEVFWSQRDFYVSNMLDVYKDVNDQRGIYLEHVIAERLMNIRDKSIIGVLPIPVILRGTWGSNGEKIMKTKEILSASIRQVLLPMPSLKEFG